VGLGKKRPIPAAVQGLGFSHIIFVGISFLLNGHFFGFLVAIANRISFP
jgi:hypothetical protein